jgi:hypothetical protein
MDDIDSDKPVTSFDDPRSRLISEFCGIERISASTFVAMQKRGVGPDALQPPGSKIRRITKQAHAAWRERMHELSLTEEAELERRRRSALARIAGKRSVEVRANKDAGHV